MIDFEFDTALLSDLPHDPLPESHAQVCPTRFADEPKLMQRTLDYETIEQMFVESLAADLRLGFWQRVQIWCLLQRHWLGALWHRLTRALAVA